MSGASSRVLLFTAAGVPLGVHLEDLLRVVPESEVLPLPLAHPALVGVMEVLEGLCPVYDLAALAGVAPGERAPGEPMVALLGLPGGCVALRLDRLGGMAADVEPLAPDEEAAELERVPAALRPLVHGVARAGRDCFCFFSTDAFLDEVSRPAAGG